MGISFTQLGRRFSAVERLGTGRRPDVSFVCIHEKHTPFRMAAFERMSACARLAGERAEVLFIELDADKKRIDALLAAFPSHRIIIPKGRVTCLEAVLLALREAHASLVCILNTAHILVNFDIDLILESFRSNLRLFALGPSYTDGTGAHFPSCVRASAGTGGLEFSLRAVTEAENAFLLQNYIGVYAREKASFLPPPAKRLAPDWENLEWFYSAWARGWQTQVDPRFCLMAEEGEEPSPFRRRRESFFDRVRFYRHEDVFLRRHGLARVRFFHNRLLCSPFSYFFSRLVPKFCARSAGGDILCAEGVFALIQENEGAPAGTGEDTPEGIACNEGVPEEFIPEMPPRMEGAACDEASPEEHALKNTAGTGAAEEERND